MNIKCTTRHTLTNTCIRITAMPLELESISITSKRSLVPLPSHTLPFPTQGDHWYDSFPPEISFHVPELPMPRIAVSTLRSFMLWGDLSNFFNHCVEQQQQQQKPHIYNPGDARTQPCTVLECLSFSPYPQVPSSSCSLETAYPSSCPILLLPLCHDSVIFWFQQGIWQSLIWYPREQDGDRRARWWFS